jgi:response regulator RpfG family c-di-GMP phosphodiesterase
LGRHNKNKRFDRDLFEYHQNVQNARMATILALAKLAEHRDDDTGIHLERMREYARIIADEMARKPNYIGYITEEYIEDIYHSSILHDIGKVGIPDAILLKPGKLTPDEFEIIKRHSTLGGDILTDIEAGIEGQTFLTLGKEIAYYHHEKWDGTGYPKGLKGEQIPLSARIVALADVYDALTSERIYKKAITHEKAKEIITHANGKHFDPDVVDSFLTREEDFKMIWEKMHNEDYYMCCGILKWHQVGSV